MRLQVITSLLLIFLASTANSSRTDWNGTELGDGQESEETIERDRLLLEEWERMNNNVYEKDGRPKEPGETLHLLKSMLEVEGKFSPRTMTKRQQIRDKIENLISKSYVSNLKCTNLFDHIELNHLIHDNLNNSLNVLPYLNHCKFEQFIICKDFWAGKLHSVVEKIDEKDKRMVEELVRTIKNTFHNEENRDRHVQIPAFANIKQGLLTYAKHLQASDGLSLTEVRQAIRQVTGVTKSKLDEMTDIYNQFLCDEQFASQMDQSTIDWSITGHICRIISRQLDFLLNEKHFSDEASQPMQNESLPTNQCWWLKE